MRALILSDIHANLEALDAVLAHAEGEYDELWNLGDLVGYGASPNQVLDRIRPLSTLVVRGNHDRVCCGLTSPNGFNPIARAAAVWTRNELTEDNLNWLRELPQGPLTPSEPNIALSHGSPLDEDQYILTMRDAFAPLQHAAAADVTFFGHTHVQGGFAQRSAGTFGPEWKDLRPPFTPRASSEAAKWTQPLDQCNRHLLNPGSVGQPRDHDWRAAYAIYQSDPAEITFHRIPYDVMGAQGRILMAQLPERLALRLREGR